MSGFLFLLAMDWIMRKTTADKRRGTAVAVFPQLVFLKEL